jgi:hypothetical protein
MVECLFDLGDRPTEPDQLARGGDRDQGPSLGARLHSGPGAIQPALRGPSDSHRLGRLAGLAVGQGLAGRGGLSVVPGRLDQQPAGVR